MDIKTYLTEMGIPFRAFSHPPVYTCEEAKKYSKGIRGVHSKNLFLKDEKSRRFYLVIIPEHKKLDMKGLGAVVGDRLKFANESDLKGILNLDSGSVSPFGLIYDREHKVELLIDKEVWESEFVSFHPNVNTETLEIPREGFHKYVSSLKNRIRII